jgi:hypothetical protein
VTACFGVAEEQARAVVIAEHGTPLTAAQALFGLAVPAQQIQRRAPHQGKVLSARVLARPMDILPALHL